MLQISTVIRYKIRILKIIYIIRHAKSDQRFWGNDFERPLNEKGYSDTRMMAKRLLEKQLKIDTLVASPAVRAQKTAELFAETLQIPTADILYISALYHAPAEIFYDVLADLPDSSNAVALFSHNPGITHFVNSLAVKVDIDNMPTCAIFAIRADIEHWTEFFKAKKEYLFFDYPKNNP